MPLTKISNLLGRLRNHHFAVFDLFVFLGAPFLALLLRSEGAAGYADYFPGLYYFILISAIVKFNLYLFFGLYSIMWSAASIDEFAKLVFANLFSAIALIIVETLLLVSDLSLIKSFTFSLILIDTAITVSFVSFSRFSIRFFKSASQKKYIKLAHNNVGIVGAGDAGILTCREVSKHPETGRITVFIDDDKSKIGLMILGIPVEGTTDNLPLIIKKYNLKKIIIAMPTAPGSAIRKISHDCIEAKVDFLTVPSITEIVDGKISFQQLRKVQVEDLLRREPINTDTKKVKEFIEGKNVLLTGAGGSIGGELCRQILSFSPDKLIVTGHGENSIFEIEHELRHLLRTMQNKRRTEIVCKIVDIRFKDNLERVFEETIPEVVFHAAAHKHVPLMENNPTEAILNNILGTKNLVDVASKVRVKDFVLISTDKAVNPANIMGTTKRIAEIITLYASRKNGNQFCAVRFGNVLGSRGSVLHTFKRQALTGGPLTITHPDIIRYFMTIPEAVQLVLQASVLSKGGEVFVLDMGEPVKISDLAKDYIKLSGLQEGIDIKIKYSGLRPGEKLFEELFVSGEEYIKTEHDKILIAANASKLVEDHLGAKIERLIRDSARLSKDEIYKRLKEIVPEFVPMKGS